MRFLLALLAFAAPAFAEDVSHPWEKFFQEDGVVKNVDHERVTTPGGVEIWRDKIGETWKYAGIDRSEHGAVGCLVAVYLDIDVMLQSCPESGSDAQRGAVDDFLRQAAKFYDANALPQITEGAFLEAMEARRANGPGCPASDEMMGNVKSTLEAWVSEEVMQSSLASLSVPRLPVMNPCQS